MQLKKYVPALMAGVLSLASTLITAQPVLQTGKGPMPNAWIDAKTGHLIKRLVNMPGNHSSFYFHNNCFVDGKMVFYGSDYIHRDSSFVADGYVNDRKDNPYNRQLFTYDLRSGAVRQLTHKSSSMNGEIISQVNHEAYFQIKDSVFAVNIHTGKDRLVFVFPEDFKASITTVNADGTLLAGAYSTPEEKEISRKYPKKSEYFNRIYESRLPRTLFTINIQTGKLNKIFTDSAWLNHVQFSTTDPDLLMFCHEGPWEKVDRIWTIHVAQPDTPRLIHKRTMYREIAGHEWFAADGSHIWYDLQLPRGEDFYIGGTELATGKETKYHLKRNEWSVHFVSSPDQSYFIGDGGSPGSVAKSPDGQWIYRFYPQGEGAYVKSEKLVDMALDDYKLEPNVHITPNEKWVVFRANFEGHTDIYAVRMQKGKPSSLTQGLQ